MKEKLKLWLEKTGYPLELYAYKCVVSRGYICEKSQIYKDIETGIAREIDLVASLNVDHGDKEFFYEVQLLIECKKSENPLVVLASENFPRERYKHFLGSEIVSDLLQDNGATYFNLSNLTENEQTQSLGRFAEKTFAGYSIVQGFGKSDENIYKGIMGLAKAGEYYRREYHDLLKMEQEREKQSEHWFQMQLPILLVDAPLFVARLDNQGDLDLEEVQWSSVKVRMPWVMDRDDQERLFVIQVVKKDFFDVFLEEVSGFHRYLIENNSVYFKK